MRVGFFSLPKKHELWLQEIAQKGSFEFTFYRHRNNKFYLSGRMVSFFPKVKFKEAIDYSIKFFNAKSKLKIPRMLLKIYFALDLFEKYLFYSLVIDPTLDRYIFWNGKKPRHLIARQIIELLGIEIRYMENGYLPNRLVFDPKGVNFENSFPKSRSFFEAYQQDLSLPSTLIPRKPENQAKFNASKTPLPKYFIFVPFQVDYDSQILLYSSWIKDMQALFDLVVYLAEESGLTFVLKEHPSSKKSYKQLHQEAQKIKNIYFFNGHSTQELIEQSEAVMTINSTVGIEALLFGKRVMVLGDAFYNIEGITKGLQDRERLLETIKNLPSWDLDKVLVENFLKYLYHEYLIPIDRCDVEQFRSILI